MFSCILYIPYIYIYIYIYMYIYIYVAILYIIGNVFELNLHLYHVFGKLTKKRWMKQERNTYKDCNSQIMHILKQNYC